MASRSHRQQQLPPPRQEDHRQHAIMRNLVLADLQPSLVRQSSVYSLTLDEVLNTILEPGKTFGSMNMEEFLSSIRTAEEGQTSTISAVGATRPITQVHHPNNGQHRPSSQIPPQETSIGDMTLEDFLIKAGVVKGGVPSTPLPPPPTPPEHLRRPQAPEFQMAQGNGIPSPSRTPADVLRAFTVDAEPTPSLVLGVGRKRSAETTMESLVERRHRRMITNRESAARSRARKHAYTIELEVEITQLREENSRLRQKALIRAEQKFEETITKDVWKDALKIGQSHHRCISCSW